MLFYGMEFNLAISHKLTLIGNLRSGIEEAEEMVKQPVALGSQYNQNGRRRLFHFQASSRKQILNIL